MRVSNEWDDNWYMIAKTSRITGSGNKGTGGL